jgi:hypothetical protein
VGNGAEPAVHGAAVQPMLRDVLLEAACSLPPDRNDVMSAAYAASGPAPATVY